VFATVVVLERGGGGDFSADAAMRPVVALFEKGFAFSVLGVAAALAARLSFGCLAETTF